MNILDQINRDKQIEVDRSLGHIGPQQLSKGSEDTRVPLDFRAALQSPGMAVIAEVKKASPSKGLIRPDFDPVAIARSYEKAGAACLSVLTESAYFQGSIGYLKAIRQVVKLPILRKDFIVDRRQIRETYDMGADALLLILSSLPDDKLVEFYAQAKEFGLSVLAEVHDQAELERASQIGFDLIGVNNRNLKTFETSLDNSLELAKTMPADAVRVSESGIRNLRDLETLEASGYGAVLVGETLMRAEDPGQALLQLTGRA